MRTRRRRKSSAVEGEGVGRVGGIERVRGHGSYGIALTFDLIPFQLFPRPRTDPYQSYLELAPTSCPTPLRDFAVRPRCRFVSFQFVARKKKKRKEKILLLLLLLLSFSSFSSSGCLSSVFDSKRTTLNLKRKKQRRSRWRVSYSSREVEFQGPWHGFGEKKERKKEYI